MHEIPDGLKSSNYCYGWCTSTFKLKNFSSYKNVSLHRNINWRFYTCLSFFDWENTSIQPWMMLLIVRNFQTVLLMLIFLVLPFMLPNNCQTSFFHQRLSWTPFGWNGEYELNISSDDVCISFWIFGKVKKDVIVLIRLDFVTDVFQYLQILSLPTKS